MSDPASTARAGRDDIVIRVRDLKNGFGDQIVTADGLTVATLLSPVQALTATDVLVVGVMV